MDDLKPPDWPALPPGVEDIFLPPNLLTLVALAFLATWLVGGLLSALAFRFTRTLPQGTRRAIRALILAITFTPSIILYYTTYTTITPAPAILLLAVPPYGWVYSFLFGALPIAVVWTALIYFWPRRHVRV